MTRAEAAKYHSTVNAEPLLTLVTRVLAERRLDVVLIGNAAAAIQCSPVTTMDFDFLVWKTDGHFRRSSSRPGDSRQRVLGLPATARNAVTKRSRTGDFWPAGQTAESVICTEN